MLILAALLGAVVLLAGVAMLMSGSKHAATERRQAAPASPGKGASRNAAVAGSAKAGEPEQAAELPLDFEITTCWKDLERFNEGVTIENFRAWAAPLLAAHDPLVRDYLKERLAELIGQDEGRARTVLGWAREATPKEFGVFMSGLKNSPAVHLPQVAEQLTAMSLDPSIDLARRAGFLAALDTQKRLEPAVLGRIADFAKDAGSGEAGWVATRTIAQVMRQDFKRTGNITPYLDQLLNIGTESSDDQIRYLALSTPMRAAPVLDARTTERYAKILTTEGDGNLREAAAHNLSLSEDKAKVLELYARAFAAEHELCVRWAIFRFAARAAGKDALPVMANMADMDPRFQPDYQAFEQIYASGILDFERVWLSLPTQDPHGCLHREDY